MQLEETLETDEEGETATPACKKPRMSDDIDKSLRVPTRVVPSQTVD